MSQGFDFIYLEHLQPWIGWAMSGALQNPAKAFAAVACIVIAVSVFKRLLNPSPYRNISGPRSSSLLFGHIPELFGPTAIPFHDHLQDTYGSVSKVKGMFGEDQLYISDPRAMQEILVKENDTGFRHPQFHYDSLNTIFGPGLITATGNVHKAQRKMLSPVFSAKHMKSLVSKFHFIAQELKDALAKELGETGSNETDIVHWCNSTALELIGQAGLGHTFGLFHGVKSAYSVAIKELLPTLAEAAPYRALFSLVYLVPSATLRRKIAEYSPAAIVQRMKQIVDIQDEQAQAILKQKKMNLQLDKNPGSPEDILSALLKLNTESAENNKLPDEQILGQINALIFAGHETTSGALARVLHILSENPAIQNRLRTELKGASSTADYDEIQSIPYMDAVCREILRLYPPAPMIERQARKNWVLPLRYPIKGEDGTRLGEINLAKGTHIYMGLREANRCRETWGDDADVFRPERWLEALPLSVVDAKIPGVYSSTMTFSAGSRACIGFKFSILELKIVLSTLVRSFEFSPSATPVEWRVSGTMAPFIAGSKIKGEPSKLPLRVTTIT